MRLNSALEDSHVLKMLERLNNPDLDEAVTDAFSQSYVTDIQDWILGGNAFKQHTGQLFGSIQYDDADNKIAAGNASVTYAKYVEFGTKNSHPFPYMFAEQESRNAHAMKDVSFVLAELLNASSHS
jgi:hypothetical protein